MEELVKEAPLEERLNSAWLHLNTASGEHFVEDANDVEAALEEVRKAFSAGDLTDKATAIRRVIEAVFVEYGANDAFERTKS